MSEKWCVVKAAEYRGDGVFDSWSIRKHDSSGYIIADLIEEEVDADFLVRACNAHEELVEALEDVLSLVGSAPSHSIGALNNGKTVQIGNASIMRWNAALAKARGAA